jgi:hypothetical protein
MGSGFWVLGSGFWVLGSGFWVLGSGFWVLGSGFWSLVSAFRVPGSGFEGENHRDASRILSGRFSKGYVESPVGCFFEIGYGNLAKNSKASL